jgi:hypothetical protein
MNKQYKTRKNMTMLQNMKAMGQAALDRLGTKHVNERNSVLRAHADMAAYAWPAKKTVSNAKPSRGNKRLPWP